MDRYRQTSSARAVPPDPHQALTLSLAKGVLSDAEGGERSRFDRLNGSAEVALALVLEGAHGPVIHAVTDSAAIHGARPGMRLTDARALNPALQVVDADPAGDRDLIDRLARWAMRWSPLVEADADSGPQGYGLRLDVSGVAHLFGREPGLIADVRAAFARLGLTVRLAIAPTPAAAWALARYGQDGNCCGADVAAALAPLPVAALRLSPLATRTLERLGLKTIDTLAGIERRSLARRFRDGDNPLDALDRALGRKAEPLAGVVVSTPPRALIRLAEPVMHPEAAPQALGLLVPRLVAELEARKLGARHLSLAGFRVDGSVGTASIATSIPSRDPRHLTRLLADRAPTLDPGFGFDAFTLTADWCEALGAAQDVLVGEPAGASELARLIDRLSVKLGAQAVRRPAPLPSHMPERASGWDLAVSSLRGAKAMKQSNTLKELDCRAPSGPAMTTARPQRLLDRPEAIAVLYATPEGLPRRFMWRRAVHDIARVQGPERIAPEWWRQPSSARLRDYYQVEDVGGRRYWIYREGLIGDGRGGDRQGIGPPWFIHGLFG